MKTGVEKDSFWSETVFGFKEPGGTPPLRYIHHDIHLHFPPRSSSVLCNVGQHSSSRRTRSY